MPDRPQNIASGPAVSLGPWTVSSLGYQEILEKIDVSFFQKKSLHLVTLNPEMIVYAEKDKAFAAIVREADLRTPDGIGILWAAHFLSLPAKQNRSGKIFQLINALISVLLAPHRIKKPLKERITGADLLLRLADYSQKKGWRIFLLGAEEGVAGIVAEKLRLRFSGVNIVGYHAGSPHEKDDPETFRRIQSVMPDILFVAYGSPKQEFWIRRNLSSLPFVRAAIGVGGAFDFYAGKIRRAPSFLRKVGLEWLWRLFRQPFRLPRIWNATGRFIRLVYRWKYPEKTATMASRLDGQK